MVDYASRFARRSNPTGLVVAIFLGRKAICGLFCLLGGGGGRCVCLWGRW